jgi:hypothetical protein
MKNFFNNKKWIGLLAALPPYVPLEPLPGATANSYNSLSAYLNLVFKILISIGAMIAVVTLVIGGITYMVSEIVDKKSEARRRMQAAIIGLLLLLTCWLILYEINPNLTTFALPGIDQQPVATAPASTQSATANNNTNTPTNQQITDCSNQGKSMHINPDNTYSCQ